uniref:DUF4116 domain-containing protein n=1 Tax=viral metagenome TaxID=1070528 RepID=A0A6C0HYN3_9ZZZZ
MNMKGGVISFTTEKQDIMPELIRYANGDITFKKAGGFGVVFQMTSDVSTILSRNGCGLQSILVKLISIDKPLQFDKVDVKQVNEDDFEDEVHIHEEICKRSLKMFHCSIAPTLLHAEIYTQEEFMRHFPKIGERITTKGRIGAIFMENMSDSETVFDLFQRDKRMVIETIFPKARRLLIMLAQVGFLHNDYKLDNLLSGDSLCIIDFGMATPITPDDMARLDTYLKEFDTEKIIEFLSVDTSHLNQIKYKGYILELQWLRQDQVDTYDPVIDPAVAIAPEESIIDPIRLEEHSLCVVSEKPVKPELQTIDPRVYETLPEHLKRNMDVIRYVLQSSGVMLSSVPEDLKTEPIVRIAVSNYGYSLKDVPERLKTKELVSMAVKNRGSSIQFAPEALKRDPELIHAAVTDESMAIKFIPEDMITKELLLLCVSKHGTALRNIPQERIDHDIAIAAVKNNGDALKYVPERFRSKQVIRIAVSNPDDEDEDLFSCFPENIKEDKPFLLQLLKINGHIVKFMDNPDGELLAYAKYSDMEDNPVDLKPVQNAKAIQFLKGKRKGDDEEFNEILDRFKMEFPSGGTRKRRRKRTRRFK